MTLCSELVDSSENINELGSDATDAHLIVLSMLGQHTNIVVVSLSSRDHGIQGLLQIRRKILKLLRLFVPEIVCVQKLQGSHGGVGYARQVR